MGSFFPVLHSRLEEANCAPEKKGRQHCPMYWTEEVKESKSKCFWKKGQHLPLPLFEQWSSEEVTLHPQWSKNGQQFPLCYIASFKNQIAHPNVLKKGQHFPLLGTNRKWIVMKVTLHPQHFWAKRAAFPPVFHSAGFKSQIARPIFLEKMGSSSPCLEQWKMNQKESHIASPNISEQTGQDFSPCFTEQVSRIKLHTLFVKKGSISTCLEQRRNE